MWVEKVSKTETKKLGVGRGEKKIPPPPAKLKSQLKKGKAKNQPGMAYK
jgi:hypothetical protein